MNSNSVFLVNPNLGHPRILNINKDLSQKTFRTQLLFITNIRDPIYFKILLADNLKFIPIFEYKWKLKQFIKKRGFREKIKSLWRSIINFLSFKKEERYFEFNIVGMDKFGHQEQEIRKIKKRDINKIKPRAFRGLPLFTKIVKVKLANLSKISDSKYIKDQYCQPQKYLSKLNVFGQLKYYYIVSLEFNLTDDILNFFSKKNFLMFDILFKNPDSGNQINYHSFVISKNNWNNINIIQATDLHLAKRNDEIFDKIDNMYRELRKKNLKKINYIETNELNSKKKKNIRKSLFKIDLSFRKRLINPNNLFRKFIKKINMKVINNEIDFLFVTGDLVDFTIKSNLSQELYNIFDYEKSNWKIFKNILLNIKQPNRKGIRQTEEILCPIFTIPGNHDYRPWQYDLNWGGIYKKVGLKKNEARALKEQYSASPIKAILKSENALKGYLSEINPSLDYFIILGDFIFIFVNTGADSYKKMTDFISGSPSLTGFTEKQIKFLNNIIKYKYDKNFKVILSMHAPPINNKFKRGILSRIKGIFKKMIRTRIEQFIESKFKGKKKSREKSRIDDKFNIRYGTISSNWEKLMNFCYKYCSLIISGHTHLLNEYRLEKTLEITSNEREERESSIAVFYDEYSKLYKKAEQIQKYNPFIVQTPALGFKSYKKPGKVGAYREIIIKKGKLSSFQVKYL